MHPFPAVNYLAILVAAIVSLIAMAMMDETAPRIVKLRAATRAVR